VLNEGWTTYSAVGIRDSVMNAELVEKKKWISEARFLHALNSCMLLPGPEALQLGYFRL
jgi:chromate transporter